jgi:hypothetical protein
LLYQITGAFAEFERSIVAASTWASRVPEHRGSASGVAPVSTDVVERIREELATGAGILKTAEVLGVGTGTVHRLKREVRLLRPNKARIGKSLPQSG